MIICVLSFPTRLAPVQVQFGVGHPFSSGISSIDYSVISMKMMQSYRESTLWRKRDLFDYSEQHVLFDTPSYFIDDVTEMYGTYLISGNEIECEFTNDLLKRVTIYPNVTAEGLGCVSKSGILYPQHYHLYGCMQFAKKIHPRFDEVFKLILNKDADAKFLLLDGARSLIPRFRNHLHSNSSEDIYRNFVFVPRSGHLDYLHLLSLHSVFLNMFPFGSGITSSEALSLCVPVIVAVGLNSVLPLAMQQISMLGEDLEKHLFAYTVKSFASKSVDVAFGRTIPLTEMKTRICERKYRLFGKDVLKNTTWEWMNFLSQVSLVY